MFVDEFVELVLPPLPPLLVVLLSRTAVPGTSWTPPVLSPSANAGIARTAIRSSTAARLPRVGGVPRQRIYDVLGALVERGLASSRPGRVVKYAATDPEIAIERLVGEHRRRLGELERDAAAMVEALAPDFLAGKKQTDPL